MRVVAEAVHAEDLEPGDLFSTAGPTYWQGVRDRASLGERVYIRTEAPCPDHERGSRIYRITIEEE